MVLRPQRSGRRKAWEIRTRLRARGRGGRGTAHGPEASFQRMTVRNRAWAFHEPARVTDGMRPREETLKIIPPNFSWK